MQFEAHQVELTRFIALRTTTKGTLQCSQIIEKTNKPLRNPT